MTSTIAFIVLLAAALHASWNALVKSGKDPLLSITAIHLSKGIVILPLVAVVGLPNSNVWPYLIASMVFHFGYYVALSESYRFGDFSEAYPVARGTAPIMVTFWGVFVLTEELSGIEMASLAGVIIGIMIFATRGFGKVVHNRRALLAALTTSVFIACYTVTDGVGGRLSGDILVYMVWLSILDAIPIIIYTTIVRSGAAVIDLRKEWKMAIPGCLMSFAAYTLVVWAMSRAPIPLVAALRETSIIIAALIGAFYFKEPSGMRRIVASVIIFLSVAMLGFDNG